MRYGRAHRVAYVEDPDQEDVVYVAKVPDGAPVVLRGSAGMIWLAVAGEPACDEESIVSRVAEQAGMRAEDLRQDVVGFLGQLTEAGYLREMP